ncbi:CoA transferase [Pollutimonas nitritireducens]|uniref:CoA transferase n=1 Tax=Pollutimonas nitritireducens TaxID=2045209 RepID=A0A2N4UAW3_9BURK|nr:CaiB/BaiF CoA-transferase family protein [Pollutimonas nitritireducens]PLC52138.1 CoA transferase [Pollutimonas nitritireducens]
MAQSLSHIRVLDLSRVFSGPWTGQMLADLGADVIKVERPGRGDDVRQQGYRAKDEQGNETAETSSFLAMNRGKRSVSINMSTPEGQNLIKELVKQSDVLIENFKAGDLVRYGLDYESLKQLNPRLIYCSITGFGQSGPYSHRPGYDPIFQSMSGLMSMTGNPPDQPGGGPQKVGYAVSDLTAGFYAIIGILAALNHRDAISGEGQYIDIALFDAQLASIGHIAMNYLISGIVPQRMGTASPITCPYQAFECTDGHLMIAVGNDSQFRQFVELLGLPELADDPRFTINRLRAQNQKVLIPMLEGVIKTNTVKYWQERLDAMNVPCGPINDFSQVFEDPQLQHRNMLIHIEHSTVGQIPQIANPLKMSATPVSYNRPPPTLSQHTDEVLGELLGLDPAAIADLKARGIT